MSDCVVADEGLSAFVLSVDVSAYKINSTLSSLTHKHLY